MRQDEALSGDLLFASQSLHDEATSGKQPYHAILDLANSMALARTALIVASGSAAGVRSIDLITGHVPTDKAPLEVLHERIQKPLPHHNQRALIPSQIYTAEDVTLAAEQVMELIVLAARMNPQLEKKLRASLDNASSNRNENAHERTFQLSR